MVADLEPFFDRVRALFPDTRGHGLSHEVRARGGLHLPAEGARTCCSGWTHLGIERAVWGGASMGGALSLWVAAHAPERVRAVVSISGPPYAPDRARPGVVGAHRPLVEAGRFEEYYDANVRLRMGEGALARLKARPERYAALTARLRGTGALAARPARRDLSRGRTGSRSAARSAAPCRSSRARWITSRPWHVPAGGGDHPGRAAPRGGGRLALSEPSHRAEVQGAIGRFFAEIGVLTT